jgi:hypothetical protein
VLPAECPRAERFAVEGAITWDNYHHARISADVREPSPAGLHFQCRRGTDHYFFLSFKQAPDDFAYNRRDIAGHGERLI